MSESSTSPIEALLQLVKSQLLDVNTAIPGVVVSYANGLAKVKPTPKKRFADGDTLDYPTIPNVRVCWPSFSGGEAGVKGPVKPGDRCLIIFSQQAIDGSDDRRMFDLQDAYAVMVDLGRAGPSDSDNNNDMTMFFGVANIQITKDGSIVINAPAGLSVNAPTASFSKDVNVGEDLAIIGTTIGNGINLNIHTHNGVQPGGGNTGIPNV